jgi:hypothetical protein
MRLQLRRAQDVDARDPVIRIVLSVPATPASSSKAGLAIDTPCTRATWG